MSSRYNYRLAGPTHYLRWGAAVLAAAAGELKKEFLRLLGAEQAAKANSSEN